MPDGGCLCGKVRISYEGEPKMRALCHCTDCRKISGSTYSTNLAVSEEGFKVSGNPKGYTTKADSGNEITSYFCGDCGSTLFRAGETFKGMRIVKAGMMDDADALNEAKPGVELFTEHRVDWVPTTSGADQQKGMGA